ncbi:hypothetical protein GCM10007860_00810 [Chitiniphilus shinanonensis]|uniref:Uncharacterized protein n=1 Tax=Chitiniphilus shinanonensis TaxID=553088 RepID=A0ABQ6BLW3_9NEIS|nr:hypothetical protein GCM10007860_00810 [Chitiniphilus shinanonensis]
MLPNRYHRPRRRAGSGAFDLESTFSPAARSMHIVVVFPTRTEAKYFHHPAAEVAFCGVGLTAAAVATTRLIETRHPDV